MIIYKCKMCGGNLNVQENSKITVCEYCGTQQTVPSTYDEKRVNLFNRANYFRQNSEFDKAIGIYEHIIEEDGSDSEAYWSLALCRYGIEYVEDPATKERKPTVNRMQAQSILNDADYKMALEHADYSQKEIYEREAGIIAAIQKDIMQIAQKEKPYDVFISYKEKAPDGYNRTKSSVLAQDIYNTLTKAGYRTFFSRISLEDKLGEKYEPYIYSALNSAKVMLVVATDKDEINAPWVKNEWSRFLAMMREDSGKTLIPCFRDMSIDELPNEFQILQGQDMSKIGAEQDLLHGIEKLICKIKREKVFEQQNRIENSMDTADRMLKNAETFMRLGNYAEAYRVYDECTKLYTDDYRGWWGLILATTENLKVFNRGSDKKIKIWFEYVKKLATENEINMLLDVYRDKCRESVEASSSDELMRIKLIYEDTEKNIFKAEKEIESINLEMKMNTEEYSKQATVLMQRLDEEKKNVEYYDGFIKKAKGIYLKLSIVLIVPVVIVYVIVNLLGIISGFNSLKCFFIVMIYAVVVVLVMVYVYFEKTVSNLKQVNLSYQEVENELKKLKNEFYKKQQDILRRLNLSVTHKAGLDRRMNLVQEYRKYQSIDNNITAQFYYSIEYAKLGIVPSVNEGFIEARTSLLKEIDG